MTESPKHYAPSLREQEVLLAAPAPTRFEYFIHKVCGWNEAWGLRSGEDSWISLADADHEVVFALWPARAYAERAAIGDWARATPDAIPLRELLNDMLPAWIANGVSVSVFWLPTGKGVLVDAAMLREALSEESAKYEEDLSTEEQDDTDT